MVCAGREFERKHLKILVGCVCCIPGRLSQFELLLVIFLGSDSEDEIEVIPTLLVNSQPQPKSSTGSIDTTDDEVECRRKPNKRPRLTKEDMASLPG